MGGSGNIMVLIDAQKQIPTNNSIDFAESDATKNTNTFRMSGKNIILNMPAGTHSI